MEEKTNQAETVNEEVVEKEEKTNQPETVNEESFMDKVKKGLSKFFSGLKNFVVKTGRKNSSNYYGMVDNIGDLIVYEDHALISAVGMDDVVFKSENVVSYSFEGLGRVRMGKATVKYKIVLDDNVVFPELVRQKNDVNNLTAEIKVEKDRSHLVGQGQIENGASGLANCDIYGYEDCFVFALNLQKQNGDKIEKYQESALYPFTDITEIGEAKNGSTVVKFKDGKRMNFVTMNDKGQALIKVLKENK